MVCRPRDCIKGFWIKLLLLTGSVFFILTLVLVSAKEFYDRELRSRTAENHQYLLDLAESQIYQFVLRITQDIQQLSILPSVSSYLNEPNVVNRQSLEEVFSATSHIYGRYDQIRLLDLKGQELVRVNYHPNGAIAVTEDQLQSKIDRYYVREGLQLKLGQFYLSPLDLNIENGAVETPFKPVIRAVMLLHDVSGQPQGMLVLNYRAESFLNSFRSLFNKRNEGMLVNSEGYWLSHKVRDWEWGWQLGRPDKKLSQWNSLLWQRVQGQAYGRFDTDNEMISFRRIQPLSFHELSDGHFTSSAGLKQDTGIQSWHLLVRSSEAQWQREAFYQAGMVKLILALLYLSAFFLSWFYLKGKSVQALKFEQQRHYAERLKSLFDHAPVGYLILDLKSRIKNINRQALDQLQYKPEELLGIHLLDLLSAESQNALNTVLADPVQLELSLEARRKDGRWLLLDATVDKSADGIALVITPARA